MGGGAGGDLKENNFTKIFKGREDISTGPKNRMLKKKKKFRKQESCNIQLRSVINRLPKMSPQDPHPILVLL